MIQPILDYYIYIGKITYYYTIKWLLVKIILENNLKKKKINFRKL